MVRVRTVRTQRSREQLRAAVVLGGLVVLSLTVWMVALTISASPTAEGGGSSTAESTSLRREPSEDAEPLEEPTVDDGAPQDPDATQDPDTSQDPEAPVATVDFDGMCEVEVDTDEQLETLRPWDFRACERAPIELPRSRTRWIVVVESLAAADFGEAEALRRVDDSAGQQLLWSSHYPSLNPGLWVVVEGPFEDRAAATRRAERVGAGAYPRELSDDEDDRYCVAADGCVGETRD